MLLQDTQRYISEWQKIYSFVELQAIEKPNTWDKLKPGFSLLAFQKKFSYKISENVRVGHD